MDNISNGDTIMFKPKNGGEFPTGEKTRQGTVEAIRNDDIIIRKADGFTDRITMKQVVN